MASVMIDPGHGGKEDGAGSNSFFKEKDVVFKISKKQYESLKKLNYDVKMTRYNDTYLDIDKRVQKIMNNKPNLCISNHISCGKGSGCEIIYSVDSDGKLANLIADKFKENNFKVRRVYQKAMANNSHLDYYALMRYTGTIETIIIEYGFADTLSNDVINLMTKLDNMADIIVKSVDEYLKEK